MNLNKDKKSSYRKRNKIILFIVIALIIVIGSVAIPQIIENSERQENEQELLKTGGAVGANVHVVNPQLEDATYKFYYEVSPGGKIDDRLVVKNNRENENTILLYVTNGTKKEGQEDQTEIIASEYDHSFFKEEKKEVSEWIKLNSNPEITLEPEELRDVTFSIEIPENTTLGEYIGGFATERVLAEETGNDNSVGIKNNFRAVKTVHIKVTDNPKEFITNTIIVFTPTVLFWLALALLIFSIIYFKTSQKKNKTK